MKLWIETLLERIFGKRKKIPHIDGNIGECRPEWTHSTTAYCHGDEVAVVSIVT
jgi:hypothetical protein